MLWKEIIEKYIADLEEAIEMKEIDIKINDKVVDWQKEFYKMLLFGEDIRKLYKKLKVAENYYGRLKIGNSGKIREYYKGMEYATRCSANEIKLLFKEFLCDETT